ncbi:MAG: hypothetical protein RIR18_79 [Pseudomonadota bacterium]|jgi:predicted transcriptional regulator
MSQETRIISEIRAARSALGWSQPELAKKSGVSLIAIARLEAGLACPRLSTVSKLQEALSSAGVRILDDQPEGGYTLAVISEAVQESERQMAKRKEAKD